MRISTLGNVLVFAGAVVGVAAVLAVAVDYSPALTPEMIKLLFYKGLGAAAVGLIFVGTWIARTGRRHEVPPAVPPGMRPPTLDPVSANGLLGEREATLRHSSAGRQPETTGRSRED